MSGYGYGAIENDDEDSLNEYSVDDEDEGCFDGYDFSRHELLKDKLFEFIKEEGNRLCLEECDRLSVPFIGLENQGATCYLNSLIQTLFLMGSFRKRVYEWDFEENIKQKQCDEGEEEEEEEQEEEEEIEKREDCILLQLQLLFAKLQFSEQRVCSTKALTRSFGWKEGGTEAFEQQDVQELCRILFDSLENYDIEITSPFKGSLVDYIKCLECDHKRAKKEKFQDISLVISRANTVQDALEQFVEVERLDGSNQYFCEHCDQKVDAIKGHRLLTLPPVLVLHLKRFIFDWEAERRIKLEDSIDISHTVDVSSVVGFENDKELSTNNKKRPTDEDEGGGKNPCEREDSLDESLCQELDSIEREQRKTTYRLDGILVHAGSATSGHYFTIVRTGENEWHEFNDCQVTQLSEKQVEDMCSKGGILADGGAYMLMYTQIGGEQDKFAKQIVPPQPIIDWVQQENEKLSQLRKVARMEKEILHFKVLLGPTVVEEDGDQLTDLYENLLPTKSITLSLHGRKATLMDAKHIAYSKLIPKEYQSRLLLSRCRLRKVYMGDHRLGDSFSQSEENETIKELGINKYTPLMLEFLRPEQIKFDNNNNKSHDKMQIRLFLWDDELKIPRPAHCTFRFTGCNGFNSKNYMFENTYSLLTSFPPVSIFNENGESVENIRVLDLKRSIYKATSIPISNQCLVRFKELLKHTNSGELEERVLIDDDNEFLSNYGIHSEDAVVLIPNEDPVTVGKRLIEECEEMKSFLTLYFNDPRNGNTKPINYTHSIRASRTMSILQLKKNMLKLLGMESRQEIIDNFHLKKSIKSKQLKDEEQTLEYYDFTNQAVVHIGKGKPIPKGMTMLRFFSSELELLFRINVFETDTIGKVRQQVAQKLNIDDPKSIRIIDRLSKKIYHNDNETLKLAIKKLQDGKSFIINELENEEEKGTDDSEIDLRIYKFDKIDSSLIGIIQSCETCVSKNSSLSQVIENFDTVLFSQIVNNDKFKICHLSSRDQQQNNTRTYEVVNSVDWFGYDSTLVFKNSISKFPLKASNDSIIGIIDSNLVETNMKFCIDHHLPIKKEIEEIPVQTEDDEIAAKELKRVLSLDLSTLPPPEERTTYQDEFMEKQDEFSESWREAAKEMNTTLTTPQVEDYKKKRVVFKPGQQVLAKDESWKRFFPGTIFSHDETLDTYAIDFQDGDRLDNCASANIRLVDVDNEKKSQDNFIEQEPLDTDRTVDHDEEEEKEKEEEEEKEEQNIEIVGLEDTELCPTDKKERRKEKLASRELRLQLMFMDDEPLDVADLRAKSSPSRSRTSSKKLVPRASSSNARLRPSVAKNNKSLEPLDSRAISMPGRTRNLDMEEPISRIPKPMKTTLQPLKKTPSTQNLIGKSFIPSPSNNNKNSKFNHAGRRILDNRDEDENKLVDLKQPAQHKKKKKNPLPPLQ